MDVTIQRGAVLDYAEKLLAAFQPDGPGAILGIFRAKDEPLIVHRGLAKLGTGEKINNSTRFRLASVTKPFTATAILQLTDAGKLTLDTDLASLFPFAPHWRDIRILHLLDHSSGLPDYEDLLRPTRRHPISDRGVLRLLSRQTARKSDPGTHWSYNNGAYCILKEIIEKVSGQSVAEYMAGHIFGPLRMTETVMANRTRTRIPHRAYGYARNQNRNTFIFSDQNLTSATQGDGSLYSTASDLGIWARESSRLLSPVLQALARTPRFSAENPDEYYGLGLRLKKLNGYSVVYHTGWSVGFRSCIYSIPEKDLSIAYLSNLDEGEGQYYAERMARFILSGPEKA